MEAVSNRVAVARLVEDKLLEAARLRVVKELVLQEVLLLVVGVVVLGRWGCWRAETETSSRTPARRKQDKTVLEFIIVY